MKIFKAILALLIIISVTGKGLSFVKPTIHKDDISADIPADIKKEIEGLYSSDPVKRAQSVIQLGRMGSRAAPAIPFLIDMLGDRDEWKQVDISALIGKYSGDIIQAKRALNEALTSLENTMGREAAKTLAKIGKPAVKPLITAVFDEFSGVSEENAIEALKLMNDPSIVDTFILAMKKGISPVAHQRYLTPDDIRQKAMRVLKHMGKPAVEPLIAELKNEDWHIREYAASLLGKIKDPRAVEPLLAALNPDENINVLNSVVYTLREIRDPRAVEPLVAVLTEKSTYIKVSLSGEREIVTRKRYPQSILYLATQALGSIKDPHAIEQLISVLNDKDEASSVKSYVAEALSQITERRFGPDPEKWQEWWKQSKEKFLKSK